MIDLEVANQTASPTVDPSVHVFLVGHSMGGIVAAETLLLLSSEQPIPAKTSTEDTNGASEDAGTDPDRAVEPGCFMFPHIQGVLAFDTPYLGIAPGVLAYGAEGHYRNASSAYNTFSDVAGMLGLGRNSRGSGTRQSSGPSIHDPNADVGRVPPAQRWGRYAMYAGAAGVIAAGGAAAMYSQRQRLTDGWDWASSHLAFVGCLARAQELRDRLSALSKVHRERGIACTNFYTCLNVQATPLNEAQANRLISQRILRSQLRTFCALPPDLDEDEPLGSSVLGLKWIKAVNRKAGDEVTAHMTMFLARDNPGFCDLVRQACNALVQSVDNSWYGTATGPVEDLDSSSEGKSDGSTGNTGYRMDGDDVVVVD